MDPALLNYIQSLQGEQMNNQQPQPQGQQPMVMQPQGMQAQQGIAQPQPVNNPFNVGISNAIESARQSLGMTQKQQDKALRSSMLTFANTMSQQPRERGFFNNFASVGKALSPAIATHDAEEEAALAQNNKLANQILAYQAAEQARQAQEEQRNWQRQHAERQLEGTEEERAWHRQHYGDQLEEQKRYHNLLHNFKKQEALDKSEGKAWEVRAMHNAKEIVPELAVKYERNQEMLPQIDELSNVLTTSKLAGSSPAAAFKRHVAKITGTDEDVLRAKNAGQFYLEWMNQNSKGTLSDMDMKAYTAGFADIDKNPISGVKVLNRLKDKIEKNQDTIRQRLELYEQDPGANLHKLDLIKRDYSQPKPQPIGQREEVPMQEMSNQGTSLPEGYIRMRDPQTGEERGVRIEDKESALNLGLEEVR